MRHVYAGLSSLLILANILYGVTPALADTTNLVPNPSVETVDSNNSLPQSWLQGNWGSNTANFSYNTNGQSGSRSVSVTISSYQSGDAKWYFSPVAVKPNTTYTFQDYYKATVVTQLVAMANDASGNPTYLWMADVPASSTWAPVTSSVTTPANTASLTIFHLISNIGTLQTDTFSLVDATPVASQPLSITSPKAGTTVSGVQTVSASSSDSSITQVQFKLDGVNLGTPDTSAPYSVTWDTTKTTNGSHTLSAVATNASGNTSTASGVAVSVSNSNVTSTGELVPNRSLETTSNGLPTNWHSNSWGNNSAQFTYLNTGHSGSHSVKAQISNYHDGDAKWYFDSVPVVPGKQYIFSDYYEANIPSEIDVALTLSDGSTQYLYLKTAGASIGWNKVDSLFTMPSGVQSATVYHIIYGNGYLITDDYSLHVYAPLPFNRPLVSLTFDDGWQNTYTNGLPILKKYSVPSTEYIISSFLGTQGYMTKDMVTAFKNQGSEIASHTVDHPDLTTLTTSQMDAELSQSQRDLQTWFGGTISDFAAPYGTINAETVTEAKKYYATYRSTDVGFNSRDDFNPYNIHVQNITANTTPTQVEAWVKQAVAQKTWLVLVYHEVSNNADLYNTTPQDLDSEVSYIKSTGAGIVTVNQAMQEITPQLSK